MLYVHFIFIGPGVLSEAFRLMPYSCNTPAIDFK